mmetsp:Transcript_11282/g.23900  ORF Transcript_11282/g.23900 Transcript_11282/m.23900 type:complete len:117 (-) Transcript_11282:144-494(-)|eukprot:CAMPEP_0201124072 /NCGR_PEP_ID=MMETSP0850-20130426/10415_1 /ASSEMBLY_ACC=CAM_ASM_000622 /TAXON_ID=183588 /ORGANISM="Pseudo-nitzschia fraudulenta, Strain WWA7" /LENGTH=116 /DNA_ID=CAMNT_0047391261 /DNA_START=99 /DNA_END=449 /DNA_ORIENTATION=+
MAPTINVKPGEVLFGEVTRSSREQDLGLKVKEREGKVFIVKVRDDGLFRKYVPIEEGDQVLTVNGEETIDTAISKYSGLCAKDVKRIFKNANHVELKLLRSQFGTVRPKEYGAVTE